MRTSRNTAAILGELDDVWPFATRLRYLSEKEFRERPSVADHEVQVAETTASIAAALGLGEHEIEDIRVAARWHDIGKLAVDPSVLFKPGRLDPVELDEMKLHTSAGVDLLGRDAPKLMKEVTSFHHERYDGFGYHGLSGEEIPFEARIVAIADVHDALVSEREYKLSMAEEDALMLMTQDVPSPGFGRRGFDPIMLRRFVRMRLEDPGFVASDENRVALAEYASSDPMNDLPKEPKASDGWLLKKSGHRLKYIDGGGVRKLDVMFDPAGHVAYRRDDESANHEYVQESASQGGKGRSRMSMKVYHFNRDRIAENDLFEVMTGVRNPDGVDLFTRLMRDGAYDLVAEVDGTNLEDAWSKTQNDIRTSSWSLAPLDGAKPLGLSGRMGHRSSMVGDIVEVDGMMHVVDIIGFKEIGPIDVISSSPSL